MIRTADEIFPDAIFAVHLDHGDEATCMDCISSGFYSSVMIDASAEPFEKNIEITRRVVDAAHAKGIVVEAELGKLGGVEEHVSVAEADAKLTDPAQAEEFVKRSGLRQPGLRHRHQPRRLQVHRQPGPALRGVRGNPEAPARLPAGHARVEFRARRTRSPHQRRRRQAQGCQGRGREASSPRPRTHGRDQGQHRYRWPPGLVPRAPRGVRDVPGELRPTATGQDLHGRIRAYIAGKNKILGSAGKLDDVRRVLH